jgi:hypothetical protein
MFNILSNPNQNLNAKMNAKTDLNTNLNVSVKQNMNQNQTVKCIRYIIMDTILTMQTEAAYESESGLDVF